MNIIWFKAALDNLRSAENSLVSGFYTTAYREATYCSENALKAVICTKDSTDLPGDLKIHDQSELLNEIKTLDLLPIDTLGKLDLILNPKDNESMGYIDITSESGDHTDCCTRQIPQTRYPKGNSTPSEMINEEDAVLRVENARKIIKILSLYFESVPPTESFW